MEYWLTVYISFFFLDIICIAALINSDSYRLMNITWMFNYLLFEFF